MDILYGLLHIGFLGLAVSQDCPITRWFFPYGTSVGDSIVDVDNFDEITGFFPIRSSMTSFNGRTFDREVDVFYRPEESIIVIGSSSSIGIRVPDLSIPYSDGAQSAVFVGRRSTRHTLPIISKAVNDMLGWGETFAPFVADVATVFTFHCQGNYDSYEKSAYQITIAFGDLGTFVIFNFDRIHYENFDYPVLMDMVSGSGSGSEFWSDPLPPNTFSSESFSGFYSEFWRTSRTVDFDLFAFFQGIIALEGEDEFLDVFYDMFPEGEHQSENLFEFFAHNSNGGHPGQWIVALSDHGLIMPYLSLTSLIFDGFNFYTPWTCMDCGGCGQRTKYENGRKIFEFGACGIPSTCIRGSNKRREWVWVKPNKRLRRARRCCYDYSEAPYEELKEPVRCSTVNGWQLA